MKLWWNDFQQVNTIIKNVVIFTGRDVQCPNAEEMVYTVKERLYFEQIETAYNYASYLLLDLMLQKNELISRLRWSH